MVLGGLLRALKAQGLQPFPDPPYINLSIKTLASKLEQISLPTLCERVYHESMHALGGLQVGNSLLPKCGMRSTIDALVNALRRDCRGLALSEYLTEEQKQYTTDN